MSFFNVGALSGNPFSTVVGQKIEQATDSTLASENWALNMEICDLINATTDGPRDAIKAIKKRMTQSAGKNYAVVMYTLTVLETCVKNCGKQFHLLVCNKEFIQELVKLIGPKNDPPTAVQEKVLSLIQCWADAFQHQPDLLGVVSIYQELRTKGIEFPMTDLDTMAPIYTPQRSVPEDQPDVAIVPNPALSITGGGIPPVGGVALGENCGVAASPQRVPASPQPRGARETPPASMVNLSPSQVGKLQADLNVVQGNMTVMADMLNEMNATKPHEHHESDLQLLQELNGTLQAMQSRLVELIGKLSDDSLTGELLRVNDELNGLLLRHQRFTKNRGVSAALQNPSAVLAAAMGAPPITATNPVEASLIDLGDETPNMSKLSLGGADKTPQKRPSSGTDKDEFDMFAQSRNLTYESSKNGTSSYADNLEPQQATVGLAALSQSRPTTGQPQAAEGNERDFDEIAAWLRADEASGIAVEPHESVTSSDFDKFLAERAAAADSSSPPPSLAVSSQAPHPGQRHPAPKKPEHDASMFAL